MNDSSYGRPDMTIFRILRWEDFKSRVKELSPSIIFYRKDPHPLRRPPIGVRLTFYHEKDMYVFIDFADGETLRKTGLPVHVTKGEGQIDDADIERFLTVQLGNIAVRSMGCFSIG